MVTKKKPGDPEEIKTPGQIIDEEPTKSIDDMTIEEMEAELKRIQLQTAILALEEQRNKNTVFLQGKEERSRRNRMRQGEMETLRLTMAAIQKQCRHQQGGKPKNVFKGTGPSCLVRVQLPDGFTWIVKCQRCRAEVYTPHPSLKHTDPKRYAQEKARFDELWEAAEEAGMETIIMPTFIFQKDGVPFIPERV